MAQALITIHTVFVCTTKETHDKEATNYLPLNLLTMHSTFTANTTRQTEVEFKDYKQEWIFVIQLIDGRWGIGQSGNPSKRIASINSGFNPMVPKPLSVHKIHGIKEQNESRTFAGVVAQFCKKYGEDKVIAL